MTWNSHDIVVVSGLPRSGTSLMMKMLEAGGLPILTDHIRQADEDNLEGYYEFERVKQLAKGDRVWLDEAEGKAVKVISALLEHLPPDHRYRVLFMHRHMDEILASQKKMLARRESAAQSPPDDVMAAAFTKHLAHVQEWLRAQSHISVLDIDYNQLLADPLPGTQSANHFLDDALDVASMVSAVRPELYRNRAR